MRTDDKIKVHFTTKLTREALDQRGRTFLYNYYLIKPRVFREESCSSLFRQQRAQYMQNYHVTATTCPRPVHVARYRGDAVIAVRVTRCGASGKQRDEEAARRRRI